MGRFVTLMIVGLALGGCLSTGEDPEVTEQRDRAALEAILTEYVAAVNAADADRLEALFWVDDPRFSEIEDHIPHPFGATTFRDIGRWIRENAKPGEKQRFHDTRFHFLGPDVAYAVSLQDLLLTETTSRVTLVFLRNRGEWRIVHGHFSTVPE